MRVTIVPVGRMDPAEVEAAAAKVAKVLGKPVELREPAPVPRTTEDTSRGQHHSGKFLAEVRAALPRLKAAKRIGGGPEDLPAGVLFQPTCAVFVTDQDLFAPATEGILTEIAPSQKAAVVSVKRLREAFWRRKADPGRQRARLVKEVLRAVGRLHGLSDCNDSQCALAPTQALADVDRKEERYCAACWRRLSQGTMRV
jgi:archaemetzincin